MQVNLFSLACCCKVMANVEPGKCDKCSWRTDWQQPPEKLTRCWVCERACCQWCTVTGHVLGSVWQKVVVKSYIFTRFEVKCSSTRGGNSSGKKSRAHAVRAVVLAVFVVIHRSRSSGRRRQCHCSAFPSDGIERVSGRRNFVGRQTETEHTFV